MLHILSSFHHIKFTDEKKEIYFKILFNFFVKHFQTLSSHVPSGAPACSPFPYISIHLKVLWYMERILSLYEVMLRKLFSCASGRKGVKKVQVFFVISRNNPKASSKCNLNDYLVCIFCQYIRQTKPIWRLAEQ